MNDGSRGMVLIVDHEPQNRDALKTALVSAGYSVVEAEDAQRALARLAEASPDVMIADVDLPGKNGFRLLREVRGGYPRVHVMLMSAHTTVEKVVEAIKGGACDFLTRPVKTEDLIRKLQTLAASEGTGAAGPSVGGAEVAFVGNSEAVRHLLDQAASACTTDDSILLVGESGSGKAKLAELIHRRSRRAANPMVKCTCVASSPEALEAALLGAPTGSNGHGTADESRSVASRGHLEAAQGGTLYLEDVDQLPPNVQARLLRILEDGMLSPSGNGEPFRLNVRFIFGSTRHLPSLVSEGRFREDLHYRIGSVTIPLPALRDRLEDLPSLAAAMLQQFAQRHGQGHTARQLHPQTLELMKEHAWPGNLRELEHVLQRAISAGAPSIITPQQLKLNHEESFPPPQLFETLSRGGGLTEMVAGVERNLIHSALRRASGNQAKAAKFLGIPRTTLRDKMAKHGLVGNGVQRDEEPARTSGERP